MKLIAVLPFLVVAGHAFDPQPCTRNTRLVRPAVQITSEATATSSLTVRHFIAPAVYLSITTHSFSQLVPIFQEKQPRWLIGDFESGNRDMIQKMEVMLRQAQLDITNAVAEMDGAATFQEDSWERETGGGGKSMVLKNGKVWEKAGVNLSVVHGTMPHAALEAATERGNPAGKGEQVPFAACGLSCVMHPRNPHCPTMHFNYRIFQTSDNWWFGGGTDNTASYLDVDDMKHFHGTLKDACDRHDPAYYPKFKQWADEYFLIQHRGESRGLR